MCCAGSNFGTTLSTTSHQNQIIELASGWAASLTMGVGQFCTNPGIAVVIAGDDASRFISAAASALEKTPAQTMLTDGIAGTVRINRLARQRAEY